MKLLSTWHKMQKWILAKEKKLKKWCKATNELIRKKISITIALTRFYLHYHFIRIKNRAIYLIHTKLFTFFTLSIAYFLAVGTVSLMLGKYIDVTVLNSQALAYFITVGAMVGGIIAIVFSFKILIMQNAADNSSAGFYRTLARDKGQDVVFFILVLSVICFFLLAVTAKSYSFTLFHQQQDLLRLLFQLSILIIALDLYLIFFLYQMLFKKIDPFSAMSQIQQSSLQYLDDIYKKATQFASLMMLHPKTDKKITKGEMLASTFQSFSTNLQYLSNRLNYLFDYHDKVLAKNERTASLRILDVIASILEKYFIIRKDSSVLLPSGFFFVSSSDSQVFLTPHLERLVTVGLDYLKHEDAVGLRKVISLFEELIGYAGQIKFVGSRRISDNPILMQCRGYLDQLMDSVIQKASFEGMFKGAQTYNSLGIYLTRKKMVHEVMQVYDMLDKIAYAALLHKQEVVFTEVLNTYSSQATVLMEDPWLFREKIDIWFEHIQQIVIWGFTVYKGQSIRQNRMQQDIARPYEMFLGVLLQTIRRIPSLQGQKKDITKSAVIEGLEELRSSLRYLSENLKNADRLLIGSLASVTEEAGIAIISLIDDPEWSDESRELINKAKWYINQPKWFTSNVTQIESNLNFDALPEAVAKMGLAAVEKNKSDIAEESIKVISQFAMEMLDKEAGDRFGFTEPRIMVLACYVGIFSLKQGMTNVVTKLKTLIPAFESAYRQKWFSQPLPPGVVITSPNENQLLVETTEVIDKIRDLNRIYGMLENAEELLLSYVNEADVKNFIREIWNVEITS